MQAVENGLNALLSSLPTRTEELDAVVGQTISQTKAQANPDNWKNQWEFALRKAIFDLAVRRFRSQPAAG